jgi:hypothetical protein
VIGRGVGMGWDGMRNKCMMIRRDEEIRIPSIYSSPPTNGVPSWSAGAIRDYNLPVTKLYDNMRLFAKDDAALE